MQNRGNPAGRFLVATLDSTPNALILMNRHSQRRRIAALVVYLVVSAAAYATELEEQESQTVKAVWSAEETIALVDYLYQHRSQAGNRGNFKTATFTAAAEAISPLLKHGPEKTEKNCRRKWSSVSDFLCAFCSHN